MKDLKEIFLNAYNFGLVEKYSECSLVHRINPPQLDLKSHKQYLNRKKLGDSGWRI